MQCNILFLAQNWAEVELDLSWALNYQDYHISQSRVSPKNLSRTQPCVTVKNTQATLKLRHTVFILSRGRIDVPDCTIWRHVPTDCGEQWCWWYRGGDGGGGPGGDGPGGDGPGGDGPGGDGPGDSVRWQWRGRGRRRAPAASRGRRRRTGVGAGGETLPWRRAETHWEDVRTGWWRMAVGCRATNGGGPPPPGMA